MNRSKSVTIKENDSVHSVNKNAIQNPCETPAGQLELACIRKKAALIKLFPLHASVTKQRNNKQNQLTQESLAGTSIHSATKPKKKYILMLYAPLQPVLSNLEEQWISAAFKPPTVSQLMG